VETPVPALAGADHISLTVTNLDRSERFYTEILGLLRLADFGHVRILIHRQTSFLVGLIRHDATDGTPFTELNTGLDHLGFAASSRDELVEWERRFVAHGVEHTPIRDMELGYHLNFRDPTTSPSRSLSRTTSPPSGSQAAEQESPAGDRARLQEYWPPSRRRPNDRGRGLPGRGQRDIQDPPTTGWDHAAEMSVLGGPRLSGRGR
jgi:catechol 2,3-dioxygenase-like lactoylglutathione lyase family enzyme